MPLNNYFISNSCFRNGITCGQWDLDSGLKQQSKTLDEFIQVTATYLMNHGSLSKKTILVGKIKQEFEKIKKTIDPDSGDKDDKPLLKNARKEPFRKLLEKYQNELEEGGVIRNSFVKTEKWSFYTGKQVKIRIN